MSTAVVLREKRVYPKAHKRAPRSHPKKGKSSGKGKRKGKKMMKKGDNRSRSSGQTRSLLRTVLPRSYLRISKSSTDMMRVEGCDVLSEVTSTAQIKTSSVPLNPLISQVFPKLSVFARIWERYKFTKVRLVYSSCAPATQSGLVGLAVRTELTSEELVSGDMLQFANYAYSEAGTVSASFATPWWHNKDKEQFFMGVRNAGATDPLKVFQGSLVGVTSNASTADDGKFAGFVSLEYECEMYNPTPGLNSVVVTNNVEAQTIDGNVVGTPIDLGGVSTEVGAYPLIPSDQTATTSYASSIAKVFKDIETGIYMVEGFFNWLGSTVMTAKYFGEKKRSPGETEDYKVASWVNPKYSVDPNLSLEQHRKRWKGHSVSKTFFAPPLVPLTAGDIIIQMKALTPISGTEFDVIFQDVFSSGTGAMELNTGHKLYFPETNWPIFVACNIPVGETRILNIANMSLAAVEVGY